MSFCKKNIVTAVWELTLKCNANCIHCGSSAGIDRTNNLSWQEVLSVVKQLAAAKCQLLSLIGGEYFLYPHWRELLTEIQKNEIPTTIITNGLLLNNEKLDFLKSVGIKALGFSIDGGTPQTHNSIRQVPNCFENVFKVAEIALQKDIRFGAITTINKINITELKVLRKLLRDKSFSSWQLQHATMFGRMNQDLSLDIFEYYIAGIFAAQTRIICGEKMHILGMHNMGYYSKVIPPHTANRFWIGCYAGKGNIGIRSDGKVLGCLSLYDERYIEGDLRQNSLKEIRHNNKFCFWNHRIEKFKKLVGYCKKCPFSLACLGGCTGYAKNKMPKCYYAIEHYWKQHKPKSEFERLFKNLTTGKMLDDGTFQFADGIKITEDYVAKLNISDRQKQLLSLITL